MTADRLDHVAGVINPALHAHTAVICDRYIASSMVLQPLDGVPAAYIDHLNAPGPTPRPRGGVIRRRPNSLVPGQPTGSHGRFEPTSTNSTAYQQVSTTLQQRGWNIHTIDTTAATITDSASHIVALIEDRDHHGVARSCELHDCSFPSRCPQGFSPPHPR